ncbi:MAG: glycosyltransferase family 4 protein [Chloroflexi bacterium]|nr:glycosyltransferase family 4 protein [Chloroflexota bacterium]
MPTTHAPPSEGNGSALRILHVITSLARGGAQTHLLELVKGQRARGHYVEVAYLKDAEMVPDFVPANRGNGDPQGGLPIPVGIAGDDGFGRGIDGIVGVAGRVMAAISSTRPDVLHTHLLKADALGAAVGWLARVGRPRAMPRAIISSKHNDEAPLRRPVVSRVHGFLSRADDAIICCSDHVASYVTTVGRAPADRIRRVYYGIDLARPVDLGAERRAEVRAELGIPDRAELVLGVGRLDPQKGWPDLLDAMATVVLSRPRAHLLIVGGAQQADERFVASLTGRATSPDLAGHVTFAGVRTDVPVLMASCDVFAMASRWEGFGLVFAEAMAAARPVVATRVSAVPEVVADGESGILVEPGDVEGLSSAIVRVLSDRPLSGRMGVAGYRRVRERFGASRMVEETVAVYREVLARRAS